MAEPVQGEPASPFWRAVGRPRSVLEVGTGGGEAADFARQKGANVFGLEPTSEAVARLGQQRFDSLIVSDTVVRGGGGEALLAKLLGLLEDGGHVVAYGSIERKEWEQLFRHSDVEVLWSTRGGTIVVARRRPAKRKLSLTVGMISMNEEKAVGPVIDDIKQRAPEAQVLLVDSSKDRTPQIAEERGARVVRQFPPRGYGPAMDRLLCEATTDVIITMDCDGTYPADRILELLRYVEDGADLVNATRTRRRPGAMPLANYVANRVFAEAAHVLHGTPTTDVHSGMRAYRTSMLRGLYVDPKGPALPVELLIVPARQGYKIVEVGIAYHERVGSTTLHRFDSTVWTFKRLLRARAGSRVRNKRFEVV